jgi:sortase A
LHLIIAKFPYKIAIIIFVRFKHKHGALKNSRLKPKFLLIISLILLGGGVYLLLLVMTPNIKPLYPLEKIDLKKLDKPDADRVIIPKVGINVQFKAGGPEVLNDYAWHRYPERGDPEKGGNFILSAHRFVIGLTPGETRRKSPFYHVEKLNVGDQILVDFNHKRYGYEITEKKAVKPDQIEIENPSKEAKLTIYTCTLGGESDGREVFIAKPLGLVSQSGNLRLNNS